MIGDAEEVAQLLERAQTGGHDDALRRAEHALLAPTGNLVNGPAGMHFVRCVAFVSQGRVSDGLEAAELMLSAPSCKASHGWRSCALSTRAWLRSLLNEEAAIEHDIDAALRDLVDAEAALAEGAEDSVSAENAHTGIGLGYSQLRLYELALPHYQAAYAVSVNDGRKAGNQAMWLSNIAILHLNWALELYRVHQPAEAEAHSLVAVEHAALAAERADGPHKARWKHYALLLAGCAAADGVDPAEAALRIQRCTEVLDTFDMRLEISFSKPFLAVALSRSGAQQLALEVIEQAVNDLPSDAGWLVTASARHTLAVLLARDGAPANQAALGYGDILARALWRQRLRSLHTATAMKSYDRFRAEHEMVARDADTDSLTGVANRRGFDRDVMRMSAPEGAECVGVLWVDLDGFKEVNDTQGHIAGDQILQAVAAELAEVVRDRDVVARLGGDEFGVLLPGADADEATLVAHRMVARVDALDRCVTVSVGVASGAASDVGATLHEADLAMYVAKRAGGNRASRHDARFAEAHRSADRLLT